MPKNFADYANTDPEIIDRFVIHAFNRNPSIRNFNDFNDALHEIDPSNDRMERANNSIIDDSAMKTLFESEATRSRIRQNVPEKEFNRIYGEEGREEESAFAVTTPERREARTSRRAMTVQVPQKKQISGYQRVVHGKEVSVRPYQKSYSKWSTAQVKFLQVRKATGVMTPKDVTREFLAHFGENSHSESGVKSKLFDI